MTGDQRRLSREEIRRLWESKWGRISDVRGRIGLLEHPAMRELMTLPGPAVALAITSNRDLDEVARSARLIADKVSKSVGARPATLAIFAQGEDPPDVREELHEGKSQDRPPPDPQPAQGRPTGAHPEALRQVEAWRDELVNLDKRNRLIHFRHTSSASLEIDEPGLIAILDRLERGGSWRFYEPEAPELLEEEDRGPRRRQADELLTQKDTVTGVRNALKALHRYQQAEFLDKGVWVTFLGVGILRWADAEGVEATAPLVMIPVELSRNGLTHDVSFADEDWIVNPAIQLRIAQDHEGFQLPQLVEETTEAVENVLRQTAEDVRRLGFDVSRQVVLSYFRFHKQAMYEDLRDNAHLIAAHPLVDALVRGANSDRSVAFEPSRVDVDVRHPAQQALSILDADSSQRQALAEASEGRSFVLDGPPGTGKSQTIANLIAESIAAGKSVLFVSEKIAALEVVKSRLEQVGLDEYVLELHSHKTSKKVVAHTLASRLNSNLVPNGMLSAQEARSLEASVARLNDYAAAVNEVREPLGRRLIDIIGEVEARSSAAAPPPPLSIDQGLDAKDFDAIEQAASTLASAWAPVERGDEFVWAGVAETFRAAGSAGLRSDAENLAHRLDRMVEAVRVVSDEWGLPLVTDAQEVDQLIAFARHTATTFPIPAPWLTSDGPDRLAERLGALRSDATAYESACRRLIEDVGESWAELPIGHSPGLAALIGSIEEDGLLNGFLPPSTEAVRGIVEQLRTAADDADRAAGLAQQVASAVGADGSSFTLRRLHDFAKLALLSDTAAKPVAAWIRSKHLRPVRDAIDALERAVAAHEAAEVAVHDVFVESILELDLENLEIRFRTVHTGMRKLSGAYRADKEVLAVHTRRGRTDRAALEAVPRALAWLKARRNLDQVAAAHAERLGHHWNGVDTDFDRCRSAIGVAESALAVAGEDLNLVRLSATLADDVDVDLLAVASDLERVTERALEAGWGLPRPVAEALFDLDVASLAARARRVADRMEEAAPVLGRVEAVCGREVTWRHAVHSLRNRDDADAVESRRAEAEGDDRRLFGGLYGGFDTDWPTVGSAIEWSGRARELALAPLSLDTAHRLLAESIETGLLEETRSRWQQSVGEFLKRFDEPHDARIADVLDLGFDDLERLLANLAITASDADTWWSFVGAKEALIERGLGEVLEHCIERGVERDRVEATIVRATLAQWVHRVIDGDERLDPIEPDQRDQLAQGFRRADVAAIRKAPSAIVARLNAGKPTLNAGGVAVINQEAAKKTRHMPVRVLMERAGRVAQSVTPCFMMSPLSVSQYLPPTLTFDLVVFDEASQVLPSDATNCIYRGTQLVIAGDQKQLPPTTFFMAMPADHDDYIEEDLPVFDSVLDLAKGGGMTSLPLRWHYRSQHEDLIAYSNYAFYEGKLVTFPGANQVADDLGVAHLVVTDGVYHRGGARNNPIEAAKVVERIRFHRERHPNLTLGVVAFSDAQATRILDEIEHAALGDPLFAGLFEEDRLDGFFVKNLESVQGDERDIVIFSVGYGPDEFGKFTMNFGPLNRSGGERRLNVAITRARRRIEVISSFRAGQMSDPQSDGVRHLRRYLDFAERGRAALAESLLVSLGEPESPFEEQVLHTIRQLGFDAVPQVGTAGYRIDIGVRDPSQPGRFVLGVECDGAMYHSAMSARDRDRLRQTVLEGLGWTIHRIWGPAWFRDREREAERLRAAIESALARSERGRPDRGPSGDRPVVFDRVGAESSAMPSWAHRYQPAVVRGSASNLFLDSQLEEMIRSIVRLETPVHPLVVFERLKEAFSMTTLTMRYRTYLTDRVRRLEVRKDLLRDSDGFLVLGGAAVVPRVPTSDPRTARKAEFVSPDEVGQAFVCAVRELGRIDEQEAIKTVATLYGWKRVTQSTRAHLTKALRRKIASGEIALAPGGESGTFLVVGEG